MLICVLPAVRCFSRTSEGREAFFLSIYIGNC